MPQNPTGRSRIVRNVLLGGGGVGKNPIGRARVVREQLVGGGGGQPHIRRTELLRGATGPMGPAGPAIVAPTDGDKHKAYFSNGDGTSTFRDILPEDIAPAFAVTLTSSQTSAEIGDTVTVTYTWSANRTCTSSFVDSDGNTLINPPASFSFTYHHTAFSAVTGTLSATPTGGATVQETATLHFDPMEFYGVHPAATPPLSNAGQSDAEAMTGQLIGGRGGTISGNVPNGSKLIGYFPKSVYVTAPTFLFGAVVTTFNVTTKTWTRKGVSQDWWACEEPQDGTGQTNVTVQ